MFKHNQTLQNYINIISSEGRLNDLIRICDMYHDDFDTLTSAIEWGFNLGEYVGRFSFGEKIWQFSVKNNDTLFYFIGDEELVSKKIEEIL